ncbi:hypothetical protein L210DRAFT_3652710 [Boletus edulis BED1]|uniref:Uncharacterized protein n=1 Tax=Boletus edulis BED1 TaxID=1328754 RepID=A0AAD4BFZ5_BOLED|nr:hypothetical protein L210DRAFT_3652710 [Boletus edulis BED1]
MKFTILMGGLDPLDTEGGNMILTLYSGKTGDEHDFAEVYPKFDSEVVDAFGEFLSLACEGRDNENGEVSNGRNANDQEENANNEQDRADANTGGEGTEATKGTNRSREDDQAEESGNPQTSTDPATHTESHPATPTAPNLATPTMSDLATPPTSDFATTLDVSITTHPGIQTPPGTQPHFPSSSRFATLSAGLATLSASLATPHQSNWGMSIFSGQPVGAPAESAGANPFASLVPSSFTNEVP